MGEIRKEHDREWFRPQFKVEFTYDYFVDGIINHKVNYELLNVEGENAERGDTQVKSSTQEERDAVKTMIHREIEEQFIADNFIPYPRIRAIYPQDGDTVSGTIKVQIEVLSLEMGEFTVSFKVDEGNWVACAYNSSTKYYEKSVNSTGITNGEHTMQLKAEDGLGDRKSVV